MYHTKGVWQWNKQERYRKLQLSIKYPMLKLSKEIHSRMWNRRKNASEGKELLVPQHTVQGREDNKRRIDEDVLLAGKEKFMPFMIEVIN